MCSFYFSQTTLRCPPLGIESDMTTYILVMKDSEGNKYESTPVTQGYGIAAFETLLLEDTTYSYYILASNVFGTNTSPTVNIGKLLYYIKLRWICMQLILLRYRSYIPHMKYNYTS